jgi:hypothetical protein
MIYVTDPLLKPIQAFLSHPQQSDLYTHLLDGMEYQVLHDICAVLSVSHAAQEVLSAEKTPTLSMTLPAYEMLIRNWLHLQAEIPILSHYIGVGIAKLQEYATLGRKSRIYALAMSKSCQLYFHFGSAFKRPTVLNPSMKLEWIENYWPLEDVAPAKEWIIQAASI